MTFTNHLKGHSGAVAIALSALALIAAGTGTAVAVSSSTTIADPTSPARQAHVDSSGHLYTTQSLTTIDATTYAYPYTSNVTTPITSATTATLAITTIAYDNSLNISLANNDVTVSLVKVTRGTSGSCYDSDATVTYLRRDAVRIGNSVSSDFSSPIQIKPSTATAAYCLGVQVRYAGTAANSSYPISATIGAFVVAGAYSGSGLHPATASPALHHTR